jgi:hypothetical protein
VAVIKDALQAEPVCNRSMNRARGTAARFAANNNALHFQHILAHDVETEAGRVRSGIFGMKEGEQHALRLQHRPQASHDGTHEAFVQIVGQVPAQNDIEMGGGILKIVGEEFAAVEDDLAFLIFGDQRRIGRCDQEIFAIDLVSAFGEEADISRLGRTEIEHAQRSLAVPQARKFSQAARAPR